jgi:glutathione synthase/RimK-type ligase-like ATP-grasp enzyme
MRRRGRGSRSLKNKWTKTKWLQSDRTLRGFVPETKLFRKTSLIAMTRRYDTVYLKPTTGTGGKGIARIEKTSTKRYRYKIDVSTKEASSINDLYRKLKKTTRGRSYLLQKGIRLQNSNGRPFDIRSTVQRSKSGKWVPTAIFVKLGKRNKVVTNYHQGGRLTLLEPTLRRAGYNPEQIARYRRKLKTLGMQTARCFERHDSRFKELGLDVALDRKGRLWILEVNTRPNYYALKSLPDKNIYRKVVRYGRTYGRTK